MNRRGTILGLVVIVVVAIVVVVALRLMGGSPTKPKPGTIVLDIKGRHPATMTLAAVANWCPVTRVAEIEAVSVDTGFAIALHEIDSVTRGPHSVLSLNPALPPPKPSATAALRWLRLADTTSRDTTTTEVVAYRSTGGRVNIEESGATLSGSLLLYLRATTGRDSVIVSGRFASLKVVAMAAGCT
jgi:hypothetical protein